MNQISDNLLGRYLTQNCTDKEKRQIEKWINASEDNRKYFTELVSIWHKLKETPQEDLIDTNRAGQELLLRLDKPGEYYPLKSVSYRKHTSGSRYLMFLRAAGIIIIILGILIGSYKLFIKKSQLTVREKEESPDKIIEGKLILADGRTISLGKEDSELTYNQTGTVILFKGDTIKNVVAKHQKENRLIYNEIIIPKGQKFRLSLPDNSLVWLNSASSFKFPLNFSEYERKVILNGEAFFEVTEKIKRPFRVQASGILIEVLGTSFNISSYEDDNFIETTLITGSLKVINQVKPQTGEHIILRPEYKATLNKDDKSISVEKVDTEIYTSWKDGYFKFQSTSFENVVKKLSRNYGIDISIMSEELKAEKFSGKLWQKDSIEDVLKYIQISTPINYSVNENSIIITNKI